MKQKIAKEFQIAMDTSGETSKELCARRNEITNSLWMTKTKIYVA
jgi:hypothetical protein